MAQRKEETEQLKVPESTLAIRQPNCTIDASTTVHSSTSPKAGLPASSSQESTAALLGREAAVAAPEPPAVVGAKRCRGCRKKVGLLGFRCRCGGLFCAEHRYSDRHVCSFDYKAAAREEIARANPVVKAAKIVRI